MYKRENLGLVTYLTKGEVNLPVDICIDTEKSHADLTLPLCIYIRNGYHNNVDEWIPISICDNPEAIGCDNLKITAVDYYDVLSFVEKYCDVLIGIAENTHDLYDDLLQKIQSKFLRESVYLIQEMAILKPNKTGLKNSIWIDVGQTFEKGGHWLRIKVQTNNSNNSHEWATLTIPDYKWIGGENLSGDEKQKVVRYAKANVAMLTSALLGNMTLTDYLVNSYKIGKDGLAIKPKEFTEWVYAYPAGHGVSIYKRNTSPYAYMYSRDGKESLFKDGEGKDIIFNIAHPFDENGKTYVPYNKEWLLIKSNGDYAYV